MSNIWHSPKIQLHIKNTYQLWAECIVTDGANLVRFIKSQRIRSLVHIHRMEDYSDVKKI